MTENGFVENKNAPLYLGAIHSSKEKARMVEIASQEEKEFLEFLKTIELKPYVSGNDRLLSVIEILGNR